MAHSRRVLVVEDDAVVRRSWSRVFELVGHTADLAGTLAEARRLLRQRSARSEAYEAVLLDLELPDGDGAELLDELEQQVPQPGVAVVSGHLDSKRALALWGRCQVDVPKPLGAEAMIELVERLAGAAEPTDRLDEFCADHGLSPTETRLLKLTAEGMGLGDIAGALGCAATTLKSLWRRIHDKTGLRSRRQVLSAAWLYRRHA